MKCIKAVIRCNSSDRSELLRIQPIKFACGEGLDACSRYVFGRFIFLTQKTVKMYQVSFLHKNTQNQTFSRPALRIRSIYKISCLIICEILS